MANEPKGLQRFQTGGEAMLALYHLDSGYRPLQVLWDIGLWLQEGEWLALLGPNGAGKSTLLKTVVGLIRPFRGEIWFEGEEIGQTPVHKRVQLGISMVPEGRRLFDGMTVKENLMMGAFIQDEDRIVSERLNGVFGLFPILEERERQVVGTLSGGEQQMCAIARALMSQPRLLLVDEMSLGLAPVVIDVLLETMLTIRGKGVTLLVVEQDVNMALAYAGRGYVLQEGKIVKSGNAAELLADPHIQKDYLGH